MNRTPIPWVKNPDGTPRLGEIRSAKEFDLDPRGRQCRIYVCCPQCGDERWVALPTTKRINYTGFCHDCNAKVRGGNRVKQAYRGKHTSGYILIKLQPNDFYYSMSGRDGYVFEHRLVMAKHLGRCLHIWEIVHHKNHTRDDNRIENLQLVSDDRHKQITILEAKITRLEKRVTVLEAENTKLNEQVRLETSSLGVGD